MTHRIPVNFLHDGNRKGIWVEPDKLPPETREKLLNNLVKKVIAGGNIDVASCADWSTKITREGVTYRPKGARRILTGAMLTVETPTLDAVLTAIDNDERNRLAVPVEPEPWHRHFNSMEGITPSHRVAPDDGNAAWRYAQAKTETEVAQ